MYTLDYMCTGYWIITALCLFFGFVLAHIVLKSIKYNIKNKPYYGWDFVDKIFHICGIMLFVFLLFVPLAFLCYEEQTDILYNLNDNIEVEGGGGIFWHYIESEVFYTYYYVENDHLRVNNIKADNIEIYWLNEEQPRVHYISDACGDPVEGEIYIPEGTIIQQFNLDAE